MKTIIILAIAVIATAALPNPFVSGTSAEQMGQRVVATFRQASPEAYTALFPTLEEFQEIMDENSLVYGDQLEAAKEEFSARYENEIIPSIHNSFTAVLHEGNKKGIDWNAITFARVEYTAPTLNLAPTPFVIVFICNGQEYKINIEKAFVLHEQWRVSATIRLI